MSVTAHLTTSMRNRSSQVRLGALLALAVTTAVVAWVAAGQSDAPRSVTAPAEDPGRTITTPRLVSGAELGAAAAAGGAPIYWAGPRREASYELTQAPGGRTFVRYLASPAELGSPRPDFLAVATYTQRNAYAAILAAAKRPGAITIRPAGGGLAVYDRGRPTSVYLAYPGVGRQIEVYSPSAAEARRVVASGAVTSVPIPGAPRIVSPSGLSNVTVSDDKGIYWAGARPKTVLELTKTSQGSVFVRYLPSASDAGSPRADFLTVATYPRRNALAGLRAAGRRPGAVTIAVRDGGLAVYDRAHPSSVYVAYPRDDRQVEVYHPDPRQARALVRSGTITPVP